MKSELGILSLSAINHSILMWSHYASGHTGFVIGFDSEREFFKQRDHEPEEIGQLLPVSYSSERVKVSCPPEDTDPSPSFIFTKNEEWAYEKEWRILRFLKEADKTTAPNV